MRIWQPLFSQHDAHCLQVPPDAYERIDEVASQTFALVEELKQVRSCKVPDGPSQTRADPESRIVRASAAGTFGATQGRRRGNQVAEVVRLPPVYPIVALLFHLGIMESFAHNALATARRMEKQ